MKKGPFILLLVTAAFLCIMIGTLIGRYTSDNYYLISEQPSASAANPTANGTPENGLLDINSASALEIADLPGIGQTLAQRIIDYRDANGPFTSIDDLILVEGIGVKRIDGIREFITVGG